MTDTKNTVSDERLVEMLRGLEGLDGGLSYQLPGDLRSILTELQSLRSQPEPAGVMVKALEWREEGKGWFRAPSELGAYSITHYAGMKSEGFKLEYGGGFTSYFSSLEEAKAAAQADYERRILSALDLSPAEEEIGRN